jgi:hypothetical protein
MGGGRPPPRSWASINMRLLTALGQDIEIVVREKPGEVERGRIRVVGVVHA